MPNLRGKTWTTTTPANVEDAQYWEDHLISDTAAAKAASSVQSVNSITPDQYGNVEIGNAGHTIQDDDGNDMPKQDVLQFVNADVTNDTVNEKTVVDCKGAKGDAATVTVGTVTTLPAGSSATVTNSGTTSAAVFDFGIPKGADGTGSVDSVNGYTGTVVLDASDVGALPDSTTIPTKTSELDNDSGFVTSSAIPTSLSELSDDSTHRLVTDAEKTAWDAKVSESLLKDTVGWVGKNLYNFEASDVKENLGATYTVSDGEVTINCTTTDYSGAFLKNALLRSKFASLANVPCILSFEYKSSVACNGLVGFSGTEEMPTTWTKKELSVSNPAQISDVVFYNRDTTKTPVISARNFMLRDASITDSTFEPYHKSVEDWYWENNPNAGVKNLIGSPVSVGSIFTRNANGSYTANGQLSSKAVVRYDFPTENGKKYKVSGCPDGGSSSTYKMDIWNIGSYFDSTPIEITGDGNTQTIEFAIVANYSANNIVFYPMVVDAQDTSSGFQPPAMTNRELTGIANTLLAAIFPYRRKLTSADDMNNIKENGFYYVEGGSDLPAHYPSSMSYRPIVVFNVGIFVIQLIINSDFIHSRKFTGASVQSWTNWYQYSGTDMGS